MEPVLDITRLFFDETGRRLAGRHIGSGLTDDAVEHWAALGFETE